MLNFTDFTQEFINQCRSSLCAASHSDVMIEKCSITKPQYGVLTGLRFNMPAVDHAPTIYVEDMYEMYKRGHCIEQLSHEAADIASRMLSMNMPFSKENIDLENNIDSLQVRLLGKSKNEPLCDSAAYMDFGNGFILIADIVKDDFRAIIRRELIEGAGMTEDELFDLALRNASKGGTVFRKLSDVVFDEPELGLEQEHDLLDTSCGIEIDIASPYVLTNREAYWGAAALYYPGVIERLCELMGDFYIVPCSVHEVLIISAASDIDPDNLGWMIKDANRTVVNDADILSDDLYICESGSVKKCSINGIIPEIHRNVC